MFRKLALGLVAAAALSATALIPTGASAHGSHGGWGHGGHHGGWGHHYRGVGFGPIIVSGGYVDDGCYEKRRVRTPYGLRWRTVNVCY